MQEQVLQAPSDIHRVHPPSTRAEYGAYVVPVDRPEGDDWAQASDGKWYPLESLRLPPPPTSIIYTRRWVILAAATVGGILIATAWVVFLIAMSLAGGYVELLTYDGSLGLGPVPIGLLPVPIGFPGLVFLQFAAIRMDARIRGQPSIYVALAAGYVGAAVMAFLFLVGMGSVSV